MPTFGAESARQLATLDHRLQSVYMEAIKFINFRVTKGHRGKVEQDEAFRTGNSKLPWPKSRHNTFPSEAADTMPHPVPEDWKENEWYTRRAFFLAGYLKATADQLGINLRQGVDWNGTGVFSAKNSWDAPHSETVADP